MPMITAFLITKSYVY